MFLQCQETSASFVGNVLQKWIVWLLCQFKWLISRGSFVCVCARVQLRCLVSWPLSTWPTMSSRTARGKDQSSPRTSRPSSWTPSNMCPGGLNQHTHPGCMMGFWVFLFNIYTWCILICRMAGKFGMFVKSPMVVLECIPCPTQTLYLLVTLVFPLCAGKERKALRSSLAGCCLSGRRGLCMRTVSWTSSHKSYVKTLTLAHSLHFVWYLFINLNTFSLFDWSFRWREKG